MYLRRPGVQIKPSLSSRHAADTFSPNLQPSEQPLLCPDALSFLEHHLSLRMYILLQEIDCIYCSYNEL